MRNENGKGQNSSIEIRSLIIELSIRYKKSAYKILTINIKYKDLIFNYNILTLNPLFKFN